MPSKSWTRIGIVLLMLAAWFTLTNHCALLVWAKSVRTHDCCQSTPDLPQPDQHICCKTLQALPLETDGKLTPAIDSNLPAELIEFEVLSAFSKMPVPAWPSNNGPPGYLSFAELVLQHSLPALAPPRVA